MGIKYRLLWKTLPYVMGLAILKSILHYFNLEPMPASSLLNAFVSGVIFTMAVIFTGTLTDFKESEKIPGELASSLKNLYKDSRLAKMKDSETTQKMQAHVTDLFKTIVSNFKQNTWKLDEINSKIDKVDEDIEYLAIAGLPPPFIVRMRNDLANIDKFSNRIYVISETTFIPAAYLITEVATMAAIVMLVLAKTASFWEELFILCGVSFLLIALIKLIPYYALSKGKRRRKDI